MRPAPLMSADPPAAHPGYVSKTDMVAALIRQLIITGELPAGGQLRQRDLAQRFGVSQTPVREALRRLESEGLVVGYSHRGFTVVASAPSCGLALIAGGPQDRRRRHHGAAGPE